MNILSLDGGGIRGVVSARILERLERACPGFMKHVHVIAGASTGGIQALKLAKGASPSELTALYVSRGKDIFRSRDWLDNVPMKLRIGLLVVSLGAAGVLLALHYKLAALIVLLVFLSGILIFNTAAKLDELFRANYSHKHLEEVLKDELGTDATMRDLQKIVLIPTFDQREWNTKFFDTFPGEERDLDQRLWEVARCTSAAPTYWPSHQWCLDGGLYANNPSDSAVASTLRHLRERELQENAEVYVAMDENEANTAATIKCLGKITVLSIGTGANPHKAPKKPRHDAGVLDTIPMLLNVVMDGGVKASAFRSDQCLGARHVRIQPKLPSPIDLADVDSVPDLIQIADLVDLDPAIKLIRERWMADAA